MYAPDFLQTPAVRCFRSLDNLHSDETAIVLPPQADQEI